MKTEDYNVFQIRYTFRDNSNVMDAVVRNRCELELLRIFDYVAKELKFQLKIETESQKKGPMRDAYHLIVIAGVPVYTDILRFISQMVLTHPKTPKGQKPSWNAALVNEMIAIAKAGLKEKNRTNPYLSEASVKSLLEEDSKLRKLVSNFFEHLVSYAKMARFDILLSTKNNKGEAVDVVEGVDRNAFKSFILESDELAPLINEDAHIEIVSPVLKTGNYRWRGIYEGAEAPIEFFMLDEDFKQSVETDRISFQNGTCIRCTLEINRRMDEEGNIFNSRYTVKMVSKVYSGNVTVETPKGKRKREEMEAAKRQLSLFD